MAHEQRTVAHEQKKVVYEQWTMTQEQRTGVCGVSKLWKPVLIRIPSTALQRDQVEAATTATV